MAISIDPTKLIKVKGSRSLSKKERANYQKQIRILNIFLNEISTDCPALYYPNFPIPKNSYFYNVSPSPQKPKILTLKKNLRRFNFENGNFVYKIEETTRDGTGTPHFFQISNEKDVEEIPIKKFTLYSLLNCRVANDDLDLFKLLIAQHLAGKLHGSKLRKNVVYPVRLNGGTVNIMLPASIIKHKIDKETLYKIHYEKKSFDYFQCESESGEFTKVPIGNLPTTNINPQKIAQQVIDSESEAFIPTNDLKKLLALIKQQLQGSRKILYPGNHLILDPDSNQWVIINLEGIIVKCTDNNDKCDHTVSDPTRYVFAEQNPFDGGSYNKVYTSNYYAQIKNNGNSSQKEELTITKSDAYVVRIETTPKVNGNTFEEVKTRKEKEHEITTKAYPATQPLIMEERSKVIRTAIVMPKLNGINLQTIITDPHYFVLYPFQMRIFLALLYINALEFFRISCNCWHNDYKPSNTMYNPATSEIKALDFGNSVSATGSTADSASPEATPSPNPIVSVQGSLLYAAPENITKNVVNSKTEAYSAGVGIIQIITGHTTAHHLNNSRMPVTNKDGNIYKLKKPEASLNLKRLFGTAYIPRIYQQCFLFIVAKATHADPNQRCTPEELRKLLEHFMIRVIEDVILKINKQIKHLEAAQFDVQAAHEKKDIWLQIRSKLESAKSQDASSKTPIRPPITIIKEHLETHSDDNQKLKQRRLSGNFFLDYFRKHRKSNSEKLLDELAPSSSASFQHLASPAA